MDHIEDCADFSFFESDSGILEWLDICRRKRNRYEDEDMLILAILASHQEVRV